MILLKVFEKLTRCYGQQFDRGEDAYEDKDRPDDIFWQGVHEVLLEGWYQEAPRRPACRHCRRRRYPRDDEHCLFTIGLQQRDYANIALDASDLVIYATKQTPILRISSIPQRASYELNEGEAGGLAADAFDHIGNECRVIVAVADDLDPRLPLKNFSKKNTKKSKNSKHS